MALHAVAGKTQNALVGRHERRPRRRRRRRWLKETVAKQRAQTTSPQPIGILAGEAPRNPRHLPCPHLPCRSIHNLSKQSYRSRQRQPGRMGTRTAHTARLTNIAALPPSLQLKAHHRTSHILRQTSSNATLHPLLLPPTAYSPIFWLWHRLQIRCPRPCLLPSSSRLRIHNRRPRINFQLSDWNATPTDAATSAHARMNPHPRSPRRCARSPLNAPCPA